MRATKPTQLTTEQLNIIKEFYLSRKHTLADIIRQCAPLGPRRPNEDCVHRAALSMGIARRDFRVLNHPGNYTIKPNRFGMAR